MSSNKPSRNEPCPCGSGKKYKYCCAEQDSPNLGNAAIVSALEKLAKFAARSDFDDRRDASRGYFTAELEELEADEFLDLLDEVGADAPYLDWAVFDECFTGEMTICDTFLADRASRHLSPDERSVLERLGASHFSYFEVLSVEDDVLEVEDLMSGEKFTATDPQGMDSASELVDSVIATRFYPNSEGGRSMHDFVALVPPTLEAELEAIAAPMKDAAQQAGWSERKLRKALGSEVLRAWFRFTCESRREYDFGDTEDLSPCRARYAVVNADALEIALASRPEIHLDPMTACWMILESQAEGAPVVGIAAIEQNELLIDSLSPDRLTRASATLESAAGESLGSAVTEPFDLEADPNLFEPFLAEDDPGNAEFADDEEDDADPSFRR